MNGNKVKKLSLAVAAALTGGVAVMQQHDAVANSTDIATSYGNVAILRPIIITALSHISFGVWLKTTGAVTLTVSNTADTVSATAGSANTKNFPDLEGSLSSNPNFGDDHAVHRAQTSVDSEPLTPYVMTASFVSGSCTSSGMSLSNFTHDTTTPTGAAVVGSGNLGAGLTLQAASGGSLGPLYFGADMGLTADTATGSHKCNFTVHVGYL